MINGYSYSIKNLLYLYLKKHFCPKCSSELAIKNMSKIVTPGSPDAKAFDFPSGLDDMYGNVKIIWQILHCPQCSLELDVSEMKQIEKEQRKTKRDSREK